MYTEEFLNDRGTTKSKLIDIVTELQSELAATGNTPLSTSELIKRKLKLADKATAVEAELARIEADKIAKLKSIEASANAEAANTLAEVMTGLRRD